MTYTRAMWADYEQDEVTSAVAAFGIVKVAFDPRLPLMLAGGAGAAMAAEDNNGVSAAILGGLGGLGAGAGIHKAVGLGGQGLSRAKRWAGGTPGVKLTGDDLRAMTPIQRDMYLQQNKVPAGQFGTAAPSVSADDVKGFNPRQQRRYLKSGVLPRRLRYADVPDGTPGALWNRIPRPHGPPPPPGPWRRAGQALVGGLGAAAGRVGRVAGSVAGRASRGVTGAAAAAGARMQNWGAPGPTFTSPLRGPPGPRPVRQTSFTGPGWGTPGKTAAYLKTADFSMGGSARGVPLSLGYASKDDRLLGMRRWVPRATIERAFEGVDEGYDPDLLVEYERERGSLAAPLIGALAGGVGTRYGLPQGGFGTTALGALVGGGLGATLHDSFAEHRGRDMREALRGVMQEHINNNAMAIQGQQNQTASESTPLVMASSTRTE